MSRVKARGTIGKLIEARSLPAVAARVASLSLLVILCAPEVARALTCIPVPLEVFPLPGDIPPNAVFVLQGTGPVSTLVRDITLDRIDLRTPEGNYPLRILERPPEPTAWIRFAPVEAKLRSGQLELWLLLDAGGREPQWSHQGTWNVQGAPDESFPRLTHQEDRAAVKVETSMWGGITAEFSVAADEPSVYWLVSVDEAESASPLGRPVSFYAAERGLSLYVGPCGGNYPLAHGKQYLADISPVDAAGHQGRATAPSILVEIP
jgi:hypothetical protein